MSRWKIEEVKERERKIIGKQTQWKRYNKETGREEREMKRQADRDITGIGGRQKNNKK